MEKRLIPDDPFLTRDKLLHLNISDHPVSIKGATRLFLANGEYRDQMICQVNLLLERKPYNPKDLGSVKETTSSIASKLRKSSPNDGIMKYLGYKERSNRL
jgi:hypothetical protein